MRCLVCIALLAGCAAPPCEPPLELASDPTSYEPFELLVVVDGSAEVAAVRPELDEVWRRTLDYALYQHGDPEARWLHERARIRFVAPSPECAAPVCDGRSTAEWVRYAPGRDDEAFHAQARCLFHAVPPCADHRPIEAVLAALDDEPIHPDSELAIVLVSARDDASSIDPGDAARALASRVHGLVHPRLEITAGDSAAPCREGHLDTVPRLRAFAEACAAHPVLQDLVRISPLCAPEVASLGGGEVVLPRRTRGSSTVSADAQGAVQCTLEEALPIRGPVSRCAEVAHLGRTFLRRDEEGREVCAIEQRPSRDGAGWYHDSTGYELRFVSGSEPMPGADVTLRCPWSARACRTDEDCTPPPFDPEWSGARARCDGERGICSLPCLEDSDCRWNGDVCSLGGCVPSASCHAPDSL